MSQENVEVVREYYAAWNQAGVRGVLPFWTPDFEWHDAPEMPDSSVYRGADEVLAHFSELEDTIGRMQVEIVDLDSASDTDVFAALRVHLAGNASGLPFEGPIFEAIKLRRGQVSQIRLFLTAPAALEAVGLRE
jgi:ketosteroid isomerase-like protein